MTFQENLWNIEDTNASFILDFILSRKKVSSSKPLALLFDIDGTLYETESRTFGIFQEWLQRQEKDDIGYIAQLQKLQKKETSYHLIELFQKAGVHLENDLGFSLLESFREYWKKHFFDNQTFLKYDTPILGSASFLQKLSQESFPLFFVTGRSPTMKEGTLQQIKNIHPSFSPSSLILKEDPSLEDHLFKKRSLEKISQQYEIIANFENEYINTFYMLENNPSIIPVILDTSHSKAPSPSLHHKVYRLQNYLEEKNAPL